MNAKAETNISETSPSLGWTPNHRAVAGTTAAVGLVGAALFYNADASSKPDIWMTSTGIMLALMYVGIVVFRRDQLRQWLLVAVGLTSAYLAMFLMNYGDWFGLSFGQPSVLDALSLANYPLAATGALIMVSRQHAKTGLHALIETLTLTIAGGLLIFVYVGVRLGEAAVGTAASIVAVLYPMGNVLLLSVLVSIFVRLRDRPGGIVLIALGFTGNLAADLISSYQRLEGTYEPGGWVDFGWLLCFIGLSAAPSWPESGRPSTLAETLDRDEGQVTLGRMAILLFALLSAPAVLVGQQLRGADATDVVATVGTIVVLTLTLARIALYNHDLRIKEAALVHAHAELTRSEQDKQSLFWRLNQAVEEERKRISADIHDLPVQKLAALGYKVETVALALMGEDIPKAAELTDQVADELSEQVANLRNLMVEVRPPVLDERGLAGAIEDAGRAFAASHPGIEVNVTGDATRLDPEAETVLYRVTQEALGNIAKHAHASLVDIDIRTVGPYVEMVIQDNGRGFDTEDRSGFVGHGHFGLAGMTERVAMLDGALEIHSTVNSGTALTFRVPTDRQPALAGTGVN